MMNRRHAFTLVELLIALGITVLIGGTVVTMMMSVSQGTRSTQDGRSHFVRGQMLQNRLREIIERSHGVLAVSSSAIVLWFDDLPDTDGEVDSNGNPIKYPGRLEDRFLVNRNEIVLIEWDSASRQVRMYYSDLTPVDALPTTSSAVSASYPTNWNSATYMAEAQKIKGQMTGLSKMAVLGTEVTAFKVNAFLPPLAPGYLARTEPLSDAVYVTATATMGSNTNTRSVVVGAMMRQRMTPK